MLPLSTESRQQYEEHWGEVERVFVDSKQEDTEELRQEILPVLLRL